MDLSGSEGSYEHPYGPELDAFVERMRSGQLVPFESEQNAYPRTLEEVDYQFVQTEEELEAMIEHFKACSSSGGEMAIDLEHHSYRTYLGFTCLVQLSSREKDYVVDALVLRGVLERLNEVTTDPRITKVFHGSEHDLIWLQRDFGVYVVNLFDTRQATKLLALPHGSLSFLLATYVDFKAKKQYQLADWRIRPLPQELVKYARADTHFLLYIAQVLRNSLRDQNLLDQAIERCTEMCRVVYTKPEFSVSDFVKMYPRGLSFSVRQLYAMEHMYALRDSIARQEDESIHYVLPNHMFKVICENLPKETTGIFACCNPTPPLVRKYVHDMFKVISDARNKRMEELEQLIKTQWLIAHLEGHESLNPALLTQEAIACRSLYRPSFSGSFAHDSAPLVWDSAKAAAAKPIKPRVRTALASFFRSPEYAAESPPRPLRNARDPNRIILAKVIDLLSRKSTAAAKAEAGTEMATMFVQPEETETIEAKRKGEEKEEAIARGREMREEVICLDSSTADAGELDSPSSGEEEEDEDGDKLVMLAQESPPRKRALPEEPDPYIEMPSPQPAPKPSAKKRRRKRKGKSATAAQPTGCGQARKRASTSASQIQDAAGPAKRKKRTR